MIWSCYWLIIRNKNWNPALAILYWIWQLCIFCVCIPFHVTNLYQKLRRKHFQKIIMIPLQIKYHIQRVDEKLEIQRRGFVSRDLLDELSGSQKKNKKLKIFQNFQTILKFKGERLCLLRFAGWAVWLPQNRNQLLIFPTLAAFTSKHLSFQLLFVLANFKLFSVK